MPKTKEEIESMPYEEREAHMWCRCCKRTRAELGEGRALYYVAAQWAYGLPPRMCGDCYGGDDDRAEARMMGVTAL